MYNLGQDLLLINENNNSFRQKVIFKFTLKTNLIKIGKKNTDKPVSIKRLLLLILAKFSKKIKEISKYFKITKQALNKSYAQVFEPTTTIKKVFKIKEAFLNF